MDNPYIKELKEKIKSTKILYGDIPQKECENYDEGICLLVDTLTKHKSDSTDIHYRKWRQFRYIKSYDSRLYEKRRHEYI